MTQDASSTVFSPFNTAHGSRFSLKKRSMKGAEAVVNLSSYNSDFLDGLFADVAKASDSSGSTTPKRSSEDMSGTPDFLMTASVTKKIRVSPRSSMSRVQASSKNLSMLAISPKGITEFHRASYDSRANDGTDTSSLARPEGSLHFQLNCVSDTSASTSCPPVSHEARVESIANLAFPNLPATVSDSSCNTGITRVSLVRQASSPEISNKESFGWFVDLDDNQQPEVNSSLPYTKSSDSLAFQASTAPRGVDDHAELEWAKAADTVDDVLGDFF